MPREWGTPLWKVLHGLTESLGNQTNRQLATDEANEVVFVLRDLEKVLPCDLCRRHYLVWRREHPLEQIAQLRGMDLRDAVRKWLFTLHEKVNLDRGIVSSIQIEQLPELYRKLDIREEWGHFYELLKVSTETGLVRQSTLQNFHRHLAILRRLVGR